MKMKTGHVLSIAASLLACTAAFAGLVSPQPVQIDFTARTAMGDMVTARNSDNKFEYIGCGVRGVAGLVSAFCQAGLGEPLDKRINCFTQDPAMIEAIHSIGDYSFITFHWDANFECTFVGTSTQSFYLPELKTKNK
jgi:hypothetical protein